MATKTADPVSPEVESDEWEDIKVGLGKEWDMEHEGPIVGTFMGMQTIDVPDKQSNEPDAVRATNAYAIEVNNGGDPNRFIWGSYNLDQAFQSINIGDTVRVEFLGVDRFEGDRGPQTVKTYRVQRKAAKPSN